MVRDKRLIVIGLVLAGMLALVGCSGEAEEAASEDTTGEAQAAEVDAGLPEVDFASAKTGWALMQEKCTICHTIDVVNAARLDWQGWEKSVNHMVDNGAQLADTEKAAVLEYLTTREQVKLYGASQMQQECMVCHTTERVNAAVLDWAGWEAAVDHMIANGAQVDPQQRAIIVEYLATKGPQG